CAAGGDGRRARADLPRACRPRRTRPTWRRQHRQRTLHRPGRPALATCRHSFALSSAMSKPALHSIHVALGLRSYPVWIGAGLLADHTRWRPLLRGRHALGSSNTSVAPLYLPRIEAGLAGLRWSSFLLDDGEAPKSFATVGRALVALGQLGATRDACVIALGGGVVGDLAGFSAAC